MQSEIKMNIVNWWEIIIAKIDENIKSASAPVTLNGPQSVALERRIRQELEEQGILAADEANLAQVNSFSSDYNFMIFTVKSTRYIQMIGWWWNIDGATQVSGWTESHFET